MIFTAFALWSLRLFKLKTQGQKKRERRAPTLGLAKSIYYLFPIVSFSCHVIRPGMALLVNMLFSVVIIMLTRVLPQTVNIMWMPHQIEQFYKDLILPKVTMSTSGFVTRNIFVVQVVTNHT